MTTEERAIAALKSLPQEKQQMALAFIESLHQKGQNGGGEKPGAQVDPIWGLGMEPIGLGLSDAAENHDAYLYGSDQ